MLRAINDAKHPNQKDPCCLEGHSLLQFIHKHAIEQGINFEEQGCQLENCLHHCFFKGHNLTQAIPREGLGDHIMCGLRNVRVELLGEKGNGNGSQMRQCHNFVSQGRSYFSLIYIVQRRQLVAEEGIGRSRRPNLHHRQSLQQSNGASSAPEASLFWSHRLKLE